MALELRPGRIDDLPLLAPIEATGDAMFVAAGHPEFADAGTIDEATAARAIVEGALHVAELDGRVVGWIQVERVGDELSVHQLSVHPDAQRRGIGGALLDAAIAHAARAGEATLVLDTQSDIAWNRPWYERFGFAVVPEAEWTDAMRAITAEQTVDGLDWSTRVHMRHELR